MTDRQRLQKWATILELAGDGIRYVMGRRLDNEGSYEEAFQSAESSASILRSLAADMTSKRNPKRKATR